MAEPDKRQIGDGSDNYGEAAKQMAKAAKEAGIETAKQAAVKGAEAGANAAAATVQAGVEGGKAVAEIAAGTAAGGPWGAILSAAWAMRHTLHLSVFPCHYRLDCFTAQRCHKQRVWAGWVDGGHGKPHNAAGIL